MRRARWRLRQRRAGGPGARGDRRAAAGPARARPAGRAATRPALRAALRGRPPASRCCRTCRARPPRRSPAISLVGTRNTRSPRAIKNRSNEPATCRQSSSAQTRSPCRPRAQMSRLANPPAPTTTVFSPTSSPVAAATAAIVCERLWVSAPSTIIDLVHPFIATWWTSGGHGLLGALPRSYQVTPDIPDRRRATQQKEVRPTGPTAAKRVSSPPGRDLLHRVGRHRHRPSQQQASKGQRRQPRR